MLVEQPEPVQADPASMAGRVAFVTGGATGLGRAIGLEFARRKVHVAFNYIEMPDRDVGEQALLTETLIRALDVEVFSAPCDVRDREEVDRFFSAAMAELGGVDVLVNNAGIARDGALWRLGVDAWREVMETNVTGAFNCTQAVARQFRSQRRGKIVNVASHHAMHPGFGVSNYSASKAALIGLTRASAVELGPSNVNVNAVAPGFIRTERLEQLPPDVIARAQRSAVLGRMAEPEDVARVVAFLCTEEARHITGQVIVIDGGMTLGS